MSLEATITANTAAFAANTAVLEKVAALLAEGNKTRAEALAGAAAVTSGKGNKGKGATAAAVATAVEPAKPIVPAAGAKGSGSAVLDAILKEFGGTVTVENIRTEFGGYLGVTDEAERTKRKANVASILAELGAAKATEMKEEDRPRAVYYLRKFVKGEAVDFKADIDSPAPAAADKEDDLL